jgi:predicted nuclease of restriction endonuclease-like (RecB) superfamily
MKPAKNDSSYELYAEIKSILDDARKSAYRAVNFTMVLAYWEIGKRIVEEEQKGNKRAGYGEALLKDLSERLTAEYGKGFSVVGLKNYRQFYLAFSQHSKGSALRSASLTTEEDTKSSALRSELQKNNAKEPDALHEAHQLRKELTWTHYRLLMRVENLQARNYYINETVAENWSTRALERQINSFYYERIVSSKNKEEVQAEAKANTGALTSQPQDFIKDPYVLEFLDIPANSGYLEKDLESGIIQKLQHFLLELGKGFSFVAQQKRISAGEDHFYIDLVFYNYILKCFVLIDLKLGKLTHQDIGQMDLYVRWYEENVKGETDNATIGIILCSEKNETVVKYSVLKDSKQLFASKYKLYLPTEEELKEELERELLNYKLEREDK